MNRIKNLIDNKYALFAIFFFLFFMTFIKPFDSDTYWHLKAGEWILSNGFPEADPFSYWGGNFVAHEWLFEIIIYFIYSIFGYTGILFSNFLIIGVILYLSINLAKRKNDSLGFIFILLPLFILYGAGFLVMRPQLFSTLFLCIEIYILEHKKHFYLLPILMLLVANIHGGMSVLFILVFLLYLFSDIYNNWGSNDKKAIKNSVIVLICMLVAMVITPFGVESIIYGTNLPDFIKQTVTEYFPLVKSSKELLILFIVVLPLACMAYTRKATLIDILMMSMSVISTIVWMRMIIVFIPIFTIYGLPYVNDTILEIKNKLFSIIKIKFDIFKVINMCIMFLLVFFIGFVGHHVFTNSLATYENAYREMPCSPIIIKEYIEENDIDIENNIMFNNYNFGGYFIFNGYKVFMDGRNDVYLEEFGSPDILPDYLDIANVTGDFLNLIEEYNIKYFALYTNDKLTHYLINNNLVDILVQDNNYIFLQIK